MAGISPHNFDDTLRAVFHPWRDGIVLSEVVDADNFEDRKAAFRQLQGFLKTIHDAGIQVAIGTDAGTPNVPFGWGMHREMAIYVEGWSDTYAGYSCGDIDGGRTDAPPDFGTLVPGKVADLVVLDADPLVDIRNTQKINRVMRLGKWLDRSQLLRAE